MTGAVLTPSSKVLFQQGHAPVAIESIASGIGPGEQPGLNMALFSHTGVAYPLQALSYDPSGEMGITDGAGATALGLDANNPGGTVVETSADGSQVGAVINTQDLTQGGTVPFGPMALLTQWQAPETVAPFADPANGALVAQLDLSLPYSELPGGPGAQTSSNQVVLYLGLTDTVSNRQIAYGEILFDSRGKPSPFFGADNGVGGTGAAIVAQAAGANSRYDVAVPGAASFQGAAWTGSQHFALEITPGTLENAITAFNNTSGPAAPFSTDLSRYILTNVSVDAEVEYFGQANSFSYSVSNMTLSEEAAPLTAAQVAAAPDAAASSVGQAAAVPAASVSASLASVVVPAGPVTSVTAGAGPETIVASAGTSYAVQAGAGTLTFLGSDTASTVTGGAGDLDASGGAGRLTAFAGSGSSTLVGGAGGGNVLAGGSGSATLVGASGGSGDLLMGGSGSARMFAGGGHSTVFGGAGASMLVASTGDDLLVAGQGQSVVYTGSGSDTVWGSPTSASQTVVVAGSGLALVAGGVGSDTMYGGSGLSTLAGGSGDQLMVAGSGGTLVFAGSGSDTVFGGPSGGTATVVGGAHAALVVLEAGAATVQAGSGGDTVFGGTGGDAIDTGAGDTVVQLSSASSQADAVTFGSGGAAVSGGGAAHAFLFGEVVAGLDVISGFRVGLDRLVMAAPQRAAALAGAHDSASGMMLPTAHGGSVVLQGVHSGGAALFG
ncbi:MAG: calcium-binding protein [Janthinobacterium lividum]